MIDQQLSYSLTTIVDSWPTEFWGLVLQFCRLNNITSSLYSKYQYHHSIRTIYGCYSRKTGIPAPGLSRRIHKDPRLNIVFAKSSPIAIVGFHMTSLKFKLKKLSILPRFYFRNVLEQLKTNFHTNFRFKTVLGSAIALNL